MGGVQLIVLPEATSTQRPDALVHAEHPPQLVAIRLIAVIALELGRLHLHDPVHPLAHDLQGLAESVDLCGRRGVAGGPHGVVALDLAAGAVDSIVDAERLVNHVVTLNEVDSRADREERVAGLVDLREDAAKHDGNPNRTDVLAQSTEAGMWRSG